MEADKGVVLFICPAFFGYEISICNALISNGYSVDFFDERSSNKSFYKAIFRIKKDVLNKAINKYYNQILEQISGKNYNWFFLIKGEVVPEWFIERFKNLNPAAKLIYYTYDSFRNNNKHSVDILKHFDVCYSFDFDDVKANPSLKLKHLFYTDDYVSPHKVLTRKHDLAFVGTLHSNRYSMIKKISSQFSNTLIFYYMPARWFFYLNKLFKKEYRPIAVSEVSFKKISKKEVAEIFRSSKCVLDIQRFGQSGLTMRTFEVLASGCVLITTNACIKEADFFDADKIVVLDDINDEHNVERIKEKIENTAIFNESMKIDFEKYFVNNWVKEFFE